MKSYKIWIDEADASQAVPRKFMDSVDAVHSWLEHYAEDDGATFPDAPFIVVVECEGVLDRYEVDASGREFEVHYLGEDKS